MLTVKEILADRVTLDIECVDRVYLNGYVKYLQLPGGLITFIREQMGFPIPSPIVLPPVTQAFRKAVEQFAAQQGVPIVEFVKGQEKDEVARAYLAQFNKPSGVVLIGTAQEKASGFTARRQDHGTKVWFVYSVVGRCVSRITTSTSWTTTLGCSSSRSAPTSHSTSRCVSMGTSGPNNSCATLASVLSR